LREISPTTKKRKEGRGKRSRDNFLKSRRKKVLRYRNENVEGEKGIHFLPRGGVKERGGEWNKPERREKGGGDKPWGFHN